MPSERDRTRLIAELASLLHECHLPEDARCASLTLIGWLARRMPGEAASADGVEHARRQTAAREIDGRSITTATAPKSALGARMRVETRALVVRARRASQRDPGSGRA